jgi:1,4-alpha-glucan branching enzyme
MPLRQDHISSTTPMGATPIAGGTTFRVWAPTASSVHVVGRFGGVDSWGASDENALEKRADGHWTGFISGAGEGDQYRFYVVGLGTSGYKRDPYARELTSEPPFPRSNGVIRSPDSYPWQATGWQPPPFNDLVIYQMHIGTWWGKDLRASVSTLLDVLKGLDYLVDLGINAVQFLPIAEFAAPRSMGYGGADLFSPEMDYTVEDLADEQFAMLSQAFIRRGKPPPSREILSVPINQVKAIIDLLHLSGIAVLFDIVLNHAGAEVRGHDDGLWFLDRQAPPDPNNSLYFTDQDHTGPVFAFWKPEVRQFLIDNAGYFAAEYRIDGYRYDQVSVIDQASDEGWRFLQACTATVRQINPSAIHIAEYWNVNPWVVRSSGQGGAGFDATWCDGLREAVRDALNSAANGGTGSVNLSAVAAQLARDDFPDRWRRVEYVESHDQVYKDRGGPRISRAADPSNPRSWYARSRSRVATGLVLTSPGIPMLFMGQEVLEDKQWSDNAEFFSDLTIYWDGLNSADRSMSDHLRFTRELVRARRAHPALRAEGIRIVNVDEGSRVLAFQRWVPGEGRDVIVVVSLNETTLYGYELGMPWQGNWIEAFNSDVYDQWVNPIAAGNGGDVIAWPEPLHGLSARASVTVPANSILIFASDAGDVR